VGSRFDREAVEFRFEAGGPIALRDLATSFSAIDVIYSRLSRGDERLSVTELRSGSIIAVLAPFLPLMNQAIPYVSSATALSDFARKLKKAIDGFAEVEKPVAPSTDVPSIAAELAEVIKPLAGRQNAAFSLAHVKYRSKTNERVVELEASYGTQEIDRAVINAERYVELTAVPTPAVTGPEQQRNFLEKVQMILHQANRGPAKAKGQTGDRGVIEAVSDKPLPVYFAEGINKLKDRMVRGAKNPLKVVYSVDAWVHREDGGAKAYTVTDVHSAAPLVDPRARLVSRPKKPRYKAVTVT
jgi:hypothetical protein